MFALFGQKKPAAPILASSPEEIKHIEHGSDEDTEIFRILALSPPLRSDVLPDLGYARIKYHLPLEYRFSDWILRYSLRKHGASIKTLYRNTKGKGASVLVLKPSVNDLSGDSNLQCIGAFISTSIVQSSNYYGNSDTFVFSVYEDIVKIHHWTGNNSFFVLSTSDTLGIGGGSGFAIHINKELDEVTTSACDTFDSPSLIRSNHGIFSCVDIEIWGFVSDR